MDTRISVGRVVVAGLVAGFVINLCELAVNVWVLGDLWVRALAGMGFSLDRSALVLWGAGTFILGIVGVWIYAAASARYGPGLRTAIRAGLAVWAIAFLFPSIGFLGMDTFPRNLMTMALITGVVETCLAIYVGSWLYREGELVETEGYPAASRASTHSASTL